MGNRTFVCLAAAVVVAVAGCSPSGGTATGQPTLSSTATGPPRKGPQPVEFQYVSFVYTSDADKYFKTRYDVITDGAGKVRMHVAMIQRAELPLSESDYIWDGNRLLEFSPMKGYPYTIWEAPSEHPLEVRDLATTNAFLWPELKGCTALGKTRTVIERTAVGYRCPETTPAPSGAATNEIWIDQATGIRLASCAGPCGTHLDIQPERLVIGPAIDESMFSTEPPGNAPTTVVPRN